jgi:NTE family protein
MRGRTRVIRQGSLNVNVGLVLSGGGARGAYQVGALRALAELVSRQRQLPFSILVGTSAGAITSSFLAAGADDFPAAVSGLVDFWSKIQPHEVFRTDPRTLAKVGLAWGADLTLGGLVGRHRRKSLLVSDPLRAVLEERLGIHAIHENVERGRLRGLALTATDYRTSRGVTFFDAAPDVQPWTRSTRYGVRALLTIDHVMASSAIPIFFPAVRIANRYYADGCLRSVTPLSPAIHLGADRILAIGIRASKIEDRWEDSDGSDAYPSIADTAGLFLNAVFVEALEMDIERLELTNRTLGLLPGSERERRAMPLRNIPLFVLRPSKDLATLATETLRRLPAVIQYLFRGLGVSGNSGQDLLSYLSFDRTYTTKLLALGYDDVMAQSGPLLDFLAGNDEH